MTDQKPLTEEGKAIPDCSWRAHREKSFAQIEADPDMSPERRQVCRKLILFVEFWTFLGEGWEEGLWKPLGYLMVPLVSPILLVGVLYYAWKYERV